MQQRSEETHARILEAANQLFSKNGYDATGVAEICLAAGISKGAFYHHFPTKQAVFMDLLDEWLSALDAGFQFLHQQTENIPHIFLNMADMVGRVFQSADVRLPIFLEVWTQANRDPVVWQAAIDPHRRYQAYFSALIQEGIAEGSLEPVDPDQTARVLVSMAIGILMQALFDPLGADWASEVRHSMLIFLNGIVRRVA